MTTSETSNESLTYAAQEPPTSDGCNLARTDRALLRSPRSRAAVSLASAIFALEANARQARATNSTLKETIGTLQAEIAVRRTAEAALTDADRRKDEFLAMVAHELRNALTPMQHSVAIMRRTPFEDPHLVWSRGWIDRQLKHLTRIVDDLLDISRLRVGALELHAASIELSAVISMAVEMCRQSIDARCHNLVVQRADYPVRMHGDSTRLVQCFANLLNNAAKYSEDGGTIWLSVEAATSPDTLREEAVIRVRDTGMGIAPDMLSKVFDPFVRSRQAHERSPGGLGIGLAVVRMLVELHHGSVSAHSEGEGRGSEFVVRLPLELEKVV